MLEVPFKPDGNPAFAATALTNLKVKEEVRNFLMAGSEGGRFDEIGSPFAVFEKWMDSCVAREERPDVWELRVELADGWVEGVFDLGRDGHLIYYHHHYHRDIGEPTIRPASGPAAGGSHASATNGKVTKAAIEGDWKLEGVTLAKMGDHWYPETERTIATRSYNTGETSGGETVTKVLDRQMMTPEGSRKAIAESFIPPNGLSAADMDKPQHPMMEWRGAKPVPLMTDTSFAEVDRQIRDEPRDRSVGRLGTWITDLVICVILGTGAYLLVRAYRRKASDV